MFTSARLSTLCRLVLAAGICLPGFALAADAAPTPTKSASAPAAKKVSKTPTNVKAGGGDSAPGCDGSHGPGKPGPKAPRCPQATVQKAGAVKAQTQSQSK